MYATAIAFYASFARISASNLCASNVSNLGYNLSSKEHWLLYIPPVLTLETLGFTHKGDLYFWCDSHYKRHLFPYTVIIVCDAGTVSCL